MKKLSLIEIRSLFYRRRNSMYARSSFSVTWFLGCVSIISKTFNLSRIVCSTLWLPVWVLWHPPPPPHQPYWQGPESLRPSCMTVTKSYNVSSCYLELDLIVIAYSRLTYIYKIVVLNKEFIQKQVKSTL